MFDVTTIPPRDEPCAADPIREALVESRPILIGLHGLTAFDPTHEAPIQINTLDTVARIDEALQQVRQSQE